MDDFDAYTKHKYEPYKAPQVPAQQEPVAWISEGGDVSRSKRYMDEMGFKCNPLYTAPSKQWVGLTDEEHDSIKHNYHNMTWTLEMFARAIEQALKGKNHG